MNTNRYQAYSNSAIHSTTDKNQILLMLYDALEKFIKFAQMAMEKSDYETKNKYINKVIAIFSELNAALDHEIGGEISQNLASLYEYMIHRITVANSKNDISILDEINGLVKGLNEAFREAAHKESNKTKTANQPAATKANQGVRFAV